MARSLGLVVAVCLLLCAVEVASFTVEDLTRKISHKSTISRITDTYEIKNAGSSATDKFNVCYLENLASQIGHLRVKQDGARAKVLGAESVQGAPAGVTCYGVQLPNSIKQGAKAKLEVVTSFIDILTPNPASIKQGDPQLMVYEDNLYVVSPYPVTKQQGEVLLPSSNVRSHSAGSKANNKVSLGPFNDIAAFSLEPLKIHFEHSGQFKRINKVVREIQLSMWGNVYVEEVYEVQNAGSKHTGKFSRLSYFHEPKGKGNSWQDLDAKLPAAADALYFKDLIGNISSSDTTRSRTTTAVNLRMRYPLMGGWKTDFVLGYSLPLEGFLYRRPKGVYRLLLDFGVPFEDAYVDELEVRVVLPEGAAHITWQLPVEADQSWDKKFTYLDTSGRPVLVFKREHVLPVHNQPFAVDFTLSTAALLHEPLLLVAAFLCFFVAVAVYHRLDFTITKDKVYLERQAREKAAGVLGSVKALWGEQAAVLRRYLLVADQLASERDTNYANSSRTELDSALKSLEGQVKEVLTQLEVSTAGSSAAASKITEDAKNLQQRAHRLIGDKADAVKKGLAAYEASQKVAPVRKQLADAIDEWINTGLAA